MSRRERMISLAKKLDIHIYQPRPKDIGEKLHVGQDYAKIIIQYLVQEYTYETRWKVDTTYVKHTAHSKIIANALGSDIRGLEFQYRVYELTISEYYNAIKPGKILFNIDYKNLDPKSNKFPKKYKDKIDVIKELFALTRSLI